MAQEPKKNSIKSYLHTVILQKKFNELKTSAAYLVNTRNEHFTDKIKKKFWKFQTISIEELPELLNEISLEFQTTPISSALLEDEDSFDGIIDLSNKALALEKEVLNLSKKITAVEDFAQRLGFAIFGFVSALLLPVTVWLAIFCTGMIAAPAALGAGAWGVVKALVRGTLSDPDVRKTILTEMKNIATSALPIVTDMYNNVKCAYNVVTAEHKDTSKQPTHSLFYKKQEDGSPVGITAEEDTSKTPTK